MLSQKEIQKIRLGNAINYLVENTKRCYEVKLFKLLFFLDFIKFKRTGRPFFHLTYTVHKAGPVPEFLFRDFKLKTSEFEDYFEIRKRKSRTPKVDEFHFVAKQPINMEVFSKIDKELLFEVATEFYEDKAAAMIAKTHFVNDPWDVTRREKGMKEVIEYTTAIDGYGEGISKEEAEEALEFLKLTKVV